MKRTLTACLLLTAFPVAAEQVRVNVSKADCIRLLTSSADYVAGVSTTGRAVAPAGLNGGGPSPDVDNMSFPVYLELERDRSFGNFGLNAGVIPFTRVEIKNGQVFVNGALLSGNGMTALKKECEAGLEK